MRMVAALLSFAFTTAALAADPAAIPAPGAEAGRAPAPVLTPVAYQPAAYGKAEGLLPGMVIGPKLALVPLPGLFGVGLEAKFLNLVGVGLDYNFFPSTGMGNVKIGFNDISLAARVFPWRSRFYLGAALGQRNFWGKASDSLTGQEIKVEVKSTYLAPELGWRFVWSSGFFMGIDLGYQIVLSPSMTLTLPPGTIDATDKKDVEDAGKEIGKVGLPIISLLQFGFYL